MILASLSIAKVIILFFTKIVVYLLIITTDLFKNKDTYSEIKKKIVSLASMFKDRLMKYKNKFSINLYFFATLIILILFLKSIDFFKKFYLIYNDDHELRQQQAYDFCENSGTGYIFYIKKNFNLETIPDIKNFRRTPNQYWIFHASKKQFNKDEKIILFNLDNNNQSKFNLSDYKILNNFKNDCLFVKKK